MASTFTSCCAGHASVTADKHESMPAERHENMSVERHENMSVERHENMPVERHENMAAERHENTATDGIALDSPPNRQEKFTDVHPPPIAKPLFCDAMRKYIRNLSRSRISYTVAVAILVLHLWALLICFVGTDAIPNGPLFGFLVLCVVGQFAGWMVHTIAEVPPLVGMLMVGVALRSSGYLVIEGPYIHVVSAIRQTGLAVLMTEAGLSIRAETLRRMSLHVLGLVIIPASGEIAGIAVLAYFILGMPWLWGALLGLVLCAVAPSVVMPSFLQLRARGLGADKGIDALLLAAASLDDVLAVCIFGVLLGIIFSTGISAMDVASHPLGLLLGVVYGTFIGFLLQHVPSPKLDHGRVVRSMLLVGAGLVATFGSAKLELIEAGPSACIVAGCVAGTWWRRGNCNYIAEQTTSHVGILWTILQVPMFGLIGADVDTSLLGKDDVLKAAVVIVGALVVRGLCTYALMMTTNFSWKEKVFITLAWLPKADVQAALGPLALDLARQTSPSNPNFERYATDLLLVAVVSILLTAPAGAAIITVLGRRLLKPATRPPTPVPDTVPSVTVNVPVEYGLRIDS